MQRTDSTHVLGALLILSKWERTAQTMRAALNALASAEPEWLTEHADPEWFERYGQRIEDQRLTKGKEARTQYLKTVGADGSRLLAPIDYPHTPEVLKELSEVEILRQIWEHYYEPTFRTPSYVVQELRMCHDPSHERDRDVQERDTGAPRLGRGDVR